MHIWANWVCAIQGIRVCLHLSVIGYSVSVIQVIRVFLDLPPNASVPLAAVVLKLSSFSPPPCSAPPSRDSRPKG